MTDRYTDTPTLPDHLDDDAVTDPDLDVIRAIYEYADRHDIDGLTTEKAIMRHFGVDPDDVVLVPDDESRTGYRVVLKEDYLGAKEGLANLKAHLSKTLRDDHGLSAADAEGLETLTDYVEAYNDARDDRE